MKLCADKLASFGLDAFLGGTIFSFGVQFLVEQCSLFY